MTDPSAPPAFEPLNALERLLVAAATGGAEQRAAFEAALPDHPLWAVPMPRANDADDVLRLRTVTAKEGGRPATALFTAAERAAEVMGPDADAVSWPGRDLLQTVRQNPAVLNPGQLYGVRWGPDAIAALLGQPNPAPRDRAPTELARPADTPEGLVANLSRELATEPAIKAAWLALGRWADGEQGFFLDIRAVPTDNPIPALITRALEGVTLDARLDVVVGAPAEAPGVGLEIVPARD